MSQDLDRATLRASEASKAARLKEAAAERAKVRQEAEEKENEALKAAIF